MPTFDMDNFFPIKCKDGYRLEKEEYDHFIDFKPSLFQRILWAVYPTRFYVKWKRVQKHQPWLHWRCFSDRRIPERPLSESLLPPKKPPFHANCRCSYDPMPISKACPITAIGEIGIGDVVIISANKTGSLVAHKAFKDEPDIDESLVIKSDPILIKENKSK